MLPFLYWSCLRQNSVEVHSRYTFNVCFAISPGNFNEYIILHRKISVFIHSSVMLSKTASTNLPTILESRYTLNNHEANCVLSLTRNKCKCINFVWNLGKITVFKNLTLFTFSNKTIESFVC